MKTRVAMVTTYNPGAAGPRFVAGHLMAHGHDVRFYHMKEFRAVAVPTTDFEEHERLNSSRQDVEFFTVQHPGEVLYLPYPSVITRREIDLFIEELRAYDPHVVGISMFTVTVNVARRLTRIIHERLPGLPVLWGGIHPMVHPNDCLRGLARAPEDLAAEAADPMAEYARDLPPTGRDDDPLQVPDILCVSEGEIPTLTLMERWDEYTRGEIPEIPGLWFIRGNEVIRSPRAPFAKSLDEYSFPLYAHKEILIDDDRVDYKFQDKRGPIIHHVYVFTERGCPYSCSFCIHSVINKMDKSYQRVRRRSVEHVFEEVERRIADHGMNHFIMHDEIFAIQKDWILEFAEAWEKRFKPRGITFTGYVHPITTDREMLVALHRAGLTRTGIGLQTGSYRIAREIYDRPMHRDRILRIMQWLAEIPFEHVQVELIVDNPFETDDDRRATLDLLTDMTPPFHVETFSLMFYSTTELIRKQGKRQELTWKDKLFWNMLYHLTGTRFLSKETLMGLSYDPWLRENPLLLEKLVMDANGQFFLQNRGFLRPFHENMSEAEMSPAELALLERRRFTQEHNGSPVDGVIEVEAPPPHASLDATAAAVSASGAAPNGRDWSGFRFRKLKIRPKTQQSIFDPQKD